MELEQLVNDETTLTGWVTFKKGFDVELDYVDRPALIEIQRKCTKTQWRRRQPVEILDEERFIKELSDRIKNWRGLNQEMLKTLFPLRPDADLNGNEVPCTDGNKAFMLKQCYGFDEFIVDSITEIETIQGERAEAEKKT